MLLICHFVLAFTELAGSTTIPEWIKTVCEDSRKEFPDSRSLDDLSKTSVILTILQRMMGIETKGRRQPGSEGRSAERQRQQVNELLRQLFTSNYKGGCKDIAKLCLLWREYKYHQSPTRQAILNQLIELGSRQGSYQDQEAVPTVSPARKSYCVEFVNAEGDDDLDKHLASWTIYENTSSVDDESVTLSRLKIRLSHQKDLLQRFENVAIEILYHIQLSIELQITIFSQDRVDLSKNIAELAKDMYRCLEEVTGQIMAIPSVLAGQEGLVHHEEQPRRSLAQRPDARSIMDSVSLDVETLSNQAFRCILLYSGLIAQGRILFSPSQDSDDDAMETFFDTPNNLEDMSAGIKSTLDTLLLLREQLDNPSTLFKRESHVKLPY
ncbi:unnamed protein product [Fusarium langsethiae]|nr:unnamed protein product [Fusarium langsethiae]